MQLNTSKKRAILDCETDGLLEDYTRVWCVSTLDYDTGYIKTFDFRNNFEGLKDLVNSYDIIVGHNLISFDRQVLQDKLGITIPISKIHDTLVLSRLANPMREGGHSLDNLGQLCHCPKTKFNDFGRFSQQMLNYCEDDVRTGYKVYCYVMNELKDFSDYSILLEHQTQFLVDDMCKAGFKLDLRLASNIRTECASKAKKIEKEILETEKPLPKKDRLFTPRKTKDHKWAKNSVGGLPIDQIGGDFTRITYEEFNLGSPKQIIKRLDGFWNPTEFTKKGIQLNKDLKARRIRREEYDEAIKSCYKISEDNLSTLTDVAPKTLLNLSEWKMLTNRVSTVDQWLEGADNNARVHSDVIHIGARTHRMGHRNPNLGNITAIDKPYGPEMRQCWTVDDGYSLLGCDASGIQLRILAHYLNNKEYTEVVIDGDIHTYHLEKMGIDKGDWDEEHGQWSNRSVAKTFIYAFLLGCGAEKAGEIIGGTPSDGRDLLNRFVELVPGLADLKQQAACAARAGRLLGFDGRYIPIESEHKALSVYLQGGETIVMRKAMAQWWNQSRKAGIDRQMVMIVHDEWCTEVEPDRAHELGKLQVQSIIDAGKFFKLNCPLDGEYKIGKSWKETH